MCEWYDTLVAVPNGENVVRAEKDLTNLMNNMVTVARHVEFRNAQISNYIYEYKLAKISNKITVWWKYLATNVDFWVGINSVRKYYYEHSKFSKTLL